MSYIPGYIFLACFAATLSFIVNLFNAGYPLWVIVCNGVLLGLSGSTAIIEEYGTR